jgi:REP element-mobilizing transposase RayT
MPQTLSNVLLHIVFSTKNREPMIRTEVEGALHGYLATACASHGCPAVQVGGTNDHVHICCRLSTTIAISDLVRKVKAGSSKWMKTHGPTFRHFAWQSGYGAFSIGASGLEELKMYIAQQEKHHRRRDFRAEFLALLKRYDIEYDERYLWSEEIVG